jgi:hypothetical protein
MNLPEPQVVCVSKSGAKGAALPAPFDQLLYLPKSVVGFVAEWGLLGTLFS